MEFELYFLYFEGKVLVMIVDVIVKFKILYMCSKQNCDKISCKYGKTTLIVTVEVLQRQRESKREKERACK